jgi:outer membrane protein assembly factor BamB
MKNIISILLVILSVTACDSIGTNKVKNLIDLTPSLEVDRKKSNLVTVAKKNPFTNLSTSSYTISRKPIISTPTIAKKVLYNVDKRGYVTAFSIKEKKKLWSTDVAKNSLDRHFNFGAVTYSDDKLYVTYGTRNLVILDAKTGHEIIRKEFPDIIRGKPVLANDRILLVQTLSNQLVGYDIEDSKFLWMNEGGLETISTSSHVMPVVYDDRALVSYSSGEIVYININNGKNIWSHNLNKLNDLGLPNFQPSVLVAKPIIINEHGYLASSNGKVIKISLNNGQVVWQKTVNDIQNMIKHENHLYVTTNARQIAAMSINDGSVNWVGNLISQVERAKNKPKTTKFLNPFVSEIAGNKLAVNIIASNGELYQFILDEKGFLPKYPKIISVKRGAISYWMSCCDASLHVITNRQIIF